MTTSTLTTWLDMTSAQRSYIVDLTEQRPTWADALDPELRDLVADTLINHAHVLAEKPHLCKALHRRLASRAISALRGVPKTPKIATVAPVSAPAPSLKQVAAKWIAEQAAQASEIVEATPIVPAPKMPSDLERLRQLIKTFPDGKNVKFALRNALGVWEFFGLDTTKSKYGNGSTYRQFRRLIGAPGAWRRGYLGVAQQLDVVRRILAVGWEQAGKDYATEHGRCFRCDAHLSDARSIAAKVGKDCADALGWAW